jgi:hypothetical protein
MNHRRVHAGGIEAECVIRERRNSGGNGGRSFNPCSIRRSHAGCMLPLGRRDPRSGRVEWKRHDVRPIRSAQRCMRCSVDRGQDQHAVKCDARDRARYRTTPACSGFQQMRNHRTTSRVECLSRSYACRIMRWYRTHYAADNKSLRDDDAAHRLRLRGRPTSQMPTTL